LAALFALSAALCLFVRTMTGLATMIGAACEMIASDSKSAKSGLIEKILGWSASVVMTTASPLGPCASIVTL